ncbi:MAG TPA: LON peptidase substrate-binding domain-containing protein [Acidimicrobiia bacterium]|nr:LON peptidase substrate-binding domain-containing protein [Acidimicrobiia bacterium]
MAETLPMFPLGVVLFPSAVLPLHVFEPRYRALVEACLAGEPEFGVVLIERGSEVGGGDVRFGVGTVARIVEAAQLPDGRYVLATVGTQRIRVDAWLTEDPYPRAEVTRIEEPAVADDVALELRRDDVERLLVRVLAMRAELGEPSAGIAARLDPDPLFASFGAAALAPIGPLDGQRLLELDGPGERLDAVHSLLVDEADVLELRLRE